MSFKDNIVKIKESLDIVDYVEKSGILLKTSDNKTYKGLCPFHSEKTPSFTVDSHYQSYRCFGCGAYGDIISFVQNIHSYDFNETINILAQDAHIVLEDVDNSTYVKRQEILECLRVTANYYSSHFKKLVKSEPNHVAVQEVLRRKVSLNGNLIYGYAPFNNDLIDYLKNKGFSDDVIIESRIGRYNENTKKISVYWRERLMFFIQDYTGKVIGFSGKKLRESDTGGKYINSKDSSVFHKQEVLYNFSNAKDSIIKNKSIIVAEGQFDVSALWEANYHNTVASLGTAFTIKHAKKIQNLISHTGSIIFCFDGDKAGKKAAISVFKNIPMIQAQSYAVSFPNDTDPSDYLMQHGKEKLHDYVKNNQITLAEFVFNNIYEKYNFKNPNDISQFYTESIEFIKSIANSVLRENIMKKLSLTINIPLSIIEKDIISHNNTFLELENAKINIFDFENKKYDIPSKDFDQNILLKNNIIKTNAKIINLLLNEPSLNIPDANILHPRFFNIYQEICEFKKQNNNKIIAEKFTDYKLVDFIINNEKEFFPFIEYLTLEDKEQLLHNIYSYLFQVKNNKDKLERIQKASYLINESKNNDIEYMLNVLSKYGLFQDNNNNKNGELITTLNISENINKAEERIIPEKIINEEIIKPVINEDIINDNNDYDDYNEIINNSDVNIFTEDDYSALQVFDNDFEEFFEDDYFVESQFMDDLNTL